MDPVQIAQFAVFLVCVYPALGTLVPIDRQWATSPMPSATNRFSFSEKIEKNIRKVGPIRQSRSGRNVICGLDRDCLRFPTTLGAHFHIVRTVTHGRKSLPRSQEMFGKRFTLAASASLVGVSFLFAQAPPDRNTQGTTLPSQSTQKGTPSATPAAPANPAIPGAVPTSPAAPAAQVGQPVPTAPAPTTNRSSGQTAPAPASRDIPASPAGPAPRPTAVGQQPGAAQNAQPQQQTGDQAQRPMSDDAKFIIKAAEINLAEINIGRLATQRASRQDIRQFAQKLVQDHSMNLNQLNQMANRNNWKNGERMDQEHQQLFQKLAGMQGPAFDKEFLQTTVDGHKKVAEIFKHASEHCKNAEIKQYATQSLAVIRQHEQEAQRLSGQNQPAATQPTSADNGANRNDQNRRER
jgi:putative membrane protein